MLPMMIITTCILSSFFVPQDALGDRCSITLTLLLAQVGFKFVISQELPRLSYATLIDFYVLVCFLITFLTVVESVTTL